MTNLDISVIAGTPLSTDTDAPMPNFIKKLLMPIECEKIAYIPRIEIMRLDLPNEPELVIEVPLEPANKLRKKFGTYDYNNLKDDYNNYIPNLKSGEYISKEGDTSSVTESFHYSEDDIIYQLPQNSVNRNSIDSIINELKSLLCTNDFSLNTRFYIVLHSKKEKEEQMGLAMDIEKETIEALEEPDEHKRESMLKKIYEDGRREAKDYWSYYELAINRIIGKDHNESFACLKKAAELAIQKEEGEILLGRILDDAEKDKKIADKNKRGAWRLITHPKQWNPIQAALKMNDGSLLTRINTNKEHHD